MDLMEYQAKELFAKHGVTTTLGTVVTTPEEVKGASVMLHQKVMRGEDLLVEAHVQVAFVSAGRAKPIPKPLRIAMKADQESGGAP